MGRFTVVVSQQEARQYFHAHGNYPAIEDLLLDADPLNYEVKKIVLSSKYVPEFRRLLDREGITNASLKPSFESIVSTIKSSWKNLNK